MQSWVVPDTQSMLWHMLQRPSDWKLVSTLFPSDLQPATGLTHQERRRLVSGHHHSFPQVALFFEGEEYLVLCDTIYRCGPMTVAYIDAFEEHGFHAVDGARGSASFRIDLCSGHVLTRAVEREADGDERFSDYDAMLGRTSVRPLEESWVILREGKGQVSRAQRARLVYATALLIAQLLEMQPTGELPYPLSREGLLDSVMAFIRDSDNEMPNLNSLAALSGYSRSRFTQLFKEHTGKTVRQYADQCRYEQSSILAAHGWGPKRLAGRFGYSSVFAFYRWRARQRRRMEAMQGDG
jgi:AraC-like DNA-binding protein